MQIEETTISFLLDLRSGMMKKWTVGIMVAAMALLGFESCKTKPHGHLLGYGPALPGLGTVIGKIGPDGKPIAEKDSTTQVSPIVPESDQ